MAKQVNTISIDHPAEPNKVLVGSFLSRRTTSTFSTDKHTKVHYSQISGGKREILSIDDDPTNQMVVEDLLIPLGYVVTCAMDGVEGLEILASRDYLPDLILLDVQMPLMTGYEVCAEIRRLYPESLPIIMISANHDESSILEGLNMGSNDYVQKPFSRAQLVARIDTHLRSRDGWMAENKRSNDLLGQVFPEHVTQKLKHGEAVISEAHDCVTVLFSDIVGYTSMSTSVNTADVFDMLNKLYTAFDALSDKHGVYKVDTIGDAYMVAAGHEESSKQDHHLRVFAMAKDMLDVANGMLAPDGSNIKIRIGIHTGPAYFGIVGVKCPKYTLIGDTVNIASRMESNGFPMCIHVSSATQKLLEDVGEWQYFGCREIKGKGSMVTYIAKVGAWEAAVASMTTKDGSATPSCASPIAAGHPSRRRSMPDDLETIGQGEFESAGDVPIEPCERAQSAGAHSGGCGSLEADSPARRPARLEDASTQTEDEEVQWMGDGLCGGGPGAKLRFRQRRNIIHKSMSTLESKGILSTTKSINHVDRFSQSARAVLSGTTDVPGSITAFAAKFAQLVEEIVEARRLAEGAAEWVGVLVVQDEIRECQAKEAHVRSVLAERRCSEAEKLLSEAQQRAEKAESRTVILAGAEGRAETLKAQIVELEGKVAAVRPESDKLLGDALAREQVAVKAAEAATCEAAATLTRAKAAERRCEELLVRIDTLEREAVERQLDDNYVQAVAAERAKLLEKEKSGVEARLAEALTQVALAEAHASSSAARVMDLESRCTEWQVRAEAAERAQSQGSTVVVSPHQESSGGCSGQYEALRDALQRIRIFEVERTSTALLLEDLSRRYDEAAAALSSGCKELARTQALLRCEQRIAEQLRDEIRTLRRSSEKQAADNICDLSFLSTSDGTNKSESACNLSRAGRLREYGAVIRESVLVLLDGFRAACPAAPLTSFSYSNFAQRTEVDELLTYLGLAHYSGALRREDVMSLSSLAQLKDSDLEVLGVSSAAARLLIQTAARGLQVLVDRSYDERRSGRYSAGNAFAR